MPYGRLLSRACRRRRLVRGRQLRHILDDAEDVLPQSRRRGRLGQQRQRRSGP